MHVKVEDKTRENVGQARQANSAIVYIQVKIEEVQYGAFDYD